MSAAEKQIQSINEIPIRFLLPGLLNQTLTEMKNRGYHLQFRREADCLFCIELNEAMFPEDFTIEEYYHFEDAIHADEARTLYAITARNEHKGYLVDTCFVYEDNISEEMIQKLRWGYEVSKSIPPNQ